MESRTHVADIFVTCSVASLGSARLLLTSKAAVVPDTTGSSPVTAAERSEQIIKTVETYKVLVKMEYMLEPIPP